MTILLVVILGVLALAMWWMRSSGAAGPSRFGGRNYRSGIGRERSTYDDPDFRSTGSIGGSSGTYQDAGYRPVSRPERREPSRPAYDDEEFRSGGSIGG
jgi:hypothetical protein